MNWGGLADEVTLGCRHVGVVGQAVGQAQLAEDPADAILTAECVVSSQ